MNTSDNTHPTTPFQQIVWRVDTPGAAVRNQMRSRAPLQLQPTVLFSLTPPSTQTTVWPVPTPAVPARPQRLNGAVEEEDDNATDLFPRNLFPN